MMLLDRDFDEFFTDAVNVLRPYLDDIVCLGGCANALYRFHPLAMHVPFEYIGTKDIDIGVPRKLQLADRPPVAKLMADIGFKELTFGDASEAVIKYGPADEDSPLDLEFLCDKSGLSARDQQRAAHAVQEGLYAQPLRYLEMSLNNVWHVPLRRVPGLERVGDINVRVPNPAAYVVSKILIRKERRCPASMRKDCFYIYEVSVVFREALDTIREEYDRLTPCVPKWKKRFGREARVLFDSEASEGPVSAVQVFRDLGSRNRDAFEVSEEMVLRSVHRFLEDLLV